MNLDTCWIGRYVRKLIIDWHIPPEVSELCSGFDANKLANDLLKANVNAVLIYTKCHYGFSYYNTKIGIKHPSLNFDYFGTLLKACKDVGLKVFAYYSVARDSLAYEQYPDWRQINSKGMPIRLTKGNWGVVCFNSPYTQDIVWPQLHEILKNYDVDGVWWDIVIFEPDCCFCEYCKQKMKAEGIDPNDRHAHHEFNELSIERFYRESYKIIKGYDPAIQIAGNSTGEVGRARRVKDWLDILTTEYIPFRHGFLYYLPYTHHMRTMGIPMDCCMSSWHKAWGDFGNFKTLTQLKYEVMHAISAGATCLIVHQPHPDGNLSSDVVNLIGSVYEFVKEREEWCIGAKAVPYVAVLADHAIGEPDDERHANSIRGAAKALLECHIPFDIIDQEANLEPYKVVILPNNRTLSDSAISRIREYVAKGGKIVATHLASLSKRMQKRIDFSLSEVFGISYHGLAPESLGYLASFKEDIRDGMPNNTPLVVYDRFTQISHIEKADVLAERRYPLFELVKGRSYSHAHAPPHPAAPAWSAAIVRNYYGKGQSIYISPPIFRAYYEHNVPFYRRLICNILNLLFEDKLIEVKAGPSVEVSLMEQDNRWILHLINYHAERRATLPLPTNVDDWGQPSPMPNPRLPYYRLPSHEVIEEIPPRFNIPIRIHLPQKPKKVYLAPSREEINVKYEGEFAELTIPRLDIHQMVVFEFT
jgi:hypothetical protein